MSVADRVVEWVSSHCLVFFFVVADLCMITAAVALAILVGAF